MGASIPLNGIAFVPVEFDISFDGFSIQQSRGLIWGGDLPVYCSIKTLGTMT
jgi:hypothetical protein